MEIEFVQRVFGSNFGLNESSEFSGVSTDTRSIKPGALFIPLKGENFDGHDYIDQAFEKGALGALVSREDSLRQNCIKVDDTLLALQNLGQAWQETIAPDVLAITGSVGKTTAKFFTAQLLSRFLKVCFSPKSFNNEIGVPLTQVLLKRDDDVLISEIGTNDKGEIRSLTDLVSPHCSLVTTVGPSHLEKLETVENVAKEKRDIYFHESIKRRIFNLDNPWTLKMSQEFKGEGITFSAKDKSADICLSAKQESIDVLNVKGHVFGESYDQTLGIFGEHHVYNIMAAYAFACYLKINPKDMLKESKVFSLPWGRGQTLKAKQGGAILFDAYNANSQSMNGLLDSIEPFMHQGCHGVFGEMLELGASGPEMHRALGKRIGAMGFESVSFLGASCRNFKLGLEDAGFGKNLVISDSYSEDLAKRVHSVVNPSETIIIKGSRGNRLERFVPLWSDELEPLG